MEPTLSILVCHLNDRVHQIESLKKSLQSQTGFDKVQILINGDNGEKSIGEKRNELIAAAQGKYIVFVDDDDHVADTYIPDILTAVEQDPDVIGIQGTIIIDGKTYLFKHSINYAGWYMADGIFYRTPNHLNPVLREIAEVVSFPEIGFGEDHAYSIQIKPHLNSEVYIRKPIYFYNPTSTKPVVI